MSKHWTPDDKIAWIKAESYAPRSRRWPAGATAGAVLIGAACAGLAFGLYQAAGPYKPVASGAEIEWNEVQAVPRAAADPTDAEWKQRAANGKAVQAY